MWLLCNKLNEILNLPCMRNGKLVLALPTAMGRVATVCSRPTVMPVRLTEMESNTVNNRSDNIPLLAYYIL